VIEVFEASGGHGKRKVGQLKVCWAADMDEARRTALEWWPNAVLRGGPLSELPRPRDFEAALVLADETAVGDAIACGPDPERHLEAIREYIAAGFDEIYVHQVGPDQEGFFDFYRREVLPRLVEADATR
jgi:alkanesulfonate monooxygenase SsuD/methylene tetrahydromethanopterin reductase-like flavin-dependent oxidoreductase (luciferase family)